MIFCVRSTIHFYSSVFVDAHTIDTKNIYRATQDAMQKACIQLFESLPFSPAKIKYLITDAMPISLHRSYIDKSTTLIAPPKAESLSSTVAAASIVAKVTRDRFVTQLAQIFPQFDLEKHKGYGTKGHIEAIDKNGLSILHRKSFVSKIVNKLESKTNGHDKRQQTIC